MLLGLVYSKYKVTTSKLPQNGIERVQKVLALPRHEAGRLEWKREGPPTDAVNWMGHLVLPRYPEVTKITVDTLCGLNYLINVLNLWYVLSLRNTIKRTVQNFARISALLNKNLKKIEPIVFGEKTNENVQAENMIKEDLTIFPMLAFPAGER